MQHKYNNEDDDDDDNNNNDNYFLLINRNLQGHLCFTDKQQTFSFKYHNLNILVSTSSYSLYEFHTEILKQIQ
jgi:hypothetical protein